MIKPNKTSDALRRKKARSTAAVPVPPVFNGELASKGADAEVDVWSLLGTAKTSSSAVRKLPYPGESRQNDNITINIPEGAGGTGPTRNEATLLPFPANKPDNSPKEPTKLEAAIAKGKAWAKRREQELLVVSLLFSINAFIASVSLVAARTNVIDRCYKSFQVGGIDNHLCFPDISILQCSETKTLSFDGKCEDGTEGYLLCGGSGIEPEVHKSAYWKESDCWTESGVFRMPFQTDIPDCKVNTGFGTGCACCDIQTCYAFNQFHVDQSRGDINVVPLDDPRYPHLHAKHQGQYPYTREQIDLIFGTEVGELDDYMSWGFCTDGTWTTDHNEARVRYSMYNATYCIALISVILEAVCFLHALLYGIFPGEHWKCGAYSMKPVTTLLIPFFTLKALGKERERNYKSKSGRAVLFIRFTCSVVLVIFTGVVLFHFKTGTKSGGTWQAMYAFISHTFDDVNEMREFVSRIREANLAETEESEKKQGKEGDSAHRDSEEETPASNQGRHSSCKKGLLVGGFVLVIIAIAVAVTVTQRRGVSPNVDDQNSTRIDEGNDAEPIPTHVNRDECGESDIEPRGWALISDMFNEADLDGDGFITVDEAKRYGAYYEFEEEIDTDHDGKMSWEEHAVGVYCLGNEQYEYAEAIAKLMPHLKQDQIDKLIESIDLNRDGFVSLLERWVARDQLFFMTYDLNGDKALSREELQTLYAHAAGESEADGEAFATSVMKYFDTDCSDYLTLDEFKPFLEWNLRGGTLNELTATDCSANNEDSGGGESDTDTEEDQMSELVFHMMDTDGNGLISREEFISFFGSTGVDFAFAHFDNDCDGLSMDEWKALEDWLLGDDPSAYPPNTGC